MGQGLGRRPGHAHRERPGRAPAGPPAFAAGVSTRDPSTRTTWSARWTTACTGGAAPHPPSTRPCTPCRCPARRPPAPRQRHRRRHGRRRGAADQGRSTATGCSGSRGGAPASSSGSTSPPSNGPTRRGGRHPRWPRDHGLGRLQRRGRGELAGGSSTRRRPTSTSKGPPSRSGRAVPERAPLPPAERRRLGRRLGAPLAGGGLHGHADGRALLRRRGRPGVPGRARNCSDWPGWGPRARTISCAPRSARWSSTCLPPSSVVPTSSGCTTLAPATTAPTTSRTTGVTRTRLPRHARRRPGHHPGPGCGHVRLRQGQADGSRLGRVLRQRHQRDAGGRGHLDLRADRREREVPRRVLGARRGQAEAPALPAPPRRPGGPGHRRRQRHRAGHRRSRWRPSGACVVVADLDVGEARRAAAEIGGADVALGVAVDVSRESAVGAAVEGVLLAFGGIDLLVNCAGLSVSKPLLETTEADWDVQHDVMAKGSFLVSKAVARTMIDQGLGGDIVYICLQERGLRRPQQRRLQRSQGGPGPPGPAAGGRAGRRTASASTASIPTASCGAAASSPVGGAPTAPPCTGYPRTSSGRSTPAAPCSSARCCPSTSPRWRWRSPQLQFGHTTGTIVPVDGGVAAAFLR